MQRDRPALTIGIFQNGSPQVGFRKMTEADVRKRYILGEEIMESTNHGVHVVQATRCRDGLSCVIKTRQRPGSFKSAALERDWRQTTEVQLGMPKTSRLCEFFEVLETPEMYYVVMERVDGKDLFELMGESPPSLEDVKEIMRQILEAVDLLHTQGRIHKDLKMENVMVELSPNSRRAAKRQSKKGGLCGLSPDSDNLSPTSPPSAKLIDFDTVEDWEPTSPKAKDVLGTDGYIAPEAYLGEYSPASDIYSVGVIMYKLLTKKFPMRDDIFDDQPGENWVGSPQMLAIHERLKRVVVDFRCFPFDVDSLAADLCSKLLAFELNDRLTSAEALCHPWFANDDSPAK